MLLPSLRDTLNIGSLDGSRKRTINRPSVTNALPRLELATPPPYRLQSCVSLVPRTVRLATPESQEANGDHPSRSILAKAEGALACHGTAGACPDNLSAAETRTAAVEKTQARKRGHTLPFQVPKPPVMDEASPTQP
jgi:hypothetical protein